MLQIMDDQNLITEECSLDSFLCGVAWLEAMFDCGIDTEFYCCSGLDHGFGLGIGTTAEGGWTWQSGFGNSRCKMSGNTRPGGYACPRIFLAMLGKRQ